MKEEKIKVLALLPMELPKEIELDNTLEAMQKFVGGLIECIAWALIKHRKFRNQVSHLEMNGSLIHGQQPCSRIPVEIFRCKTWRCSKRTPL